MFPKKHRSTYIPIWTGKGYPGMREFANTISCMARASRWWQSAERIASDPRS